MSTGAAELLQDTGGTVGGPQTEGAREIAARSPLQLFWRRLRRTRSALVALGFIVLLLICAIFANQVIHLIGAAAAEPAVDEVPRQLRLGLRPVVGELVRDRRPRPHVFSRVVLRRAGLAARSR